MGQYGRPSLALAGLLVCNAANSSIDRVKFITHSISSQMLCKVSSYQYTSSSGLDLDTRR